MSLPKLAARVVLGSSATLVPLVALEAGSASNLDSGTELSFTSAPEGVDSTVTVKTLDGGVDAVSALTAELAQGVRQRVSA